MSTLLNSLKADQALSGEDILTRTKALHSLFKYTEEGTSYSFSEYLKKLVHEAHTVPPIQLQTQVAPGTGDTYLVQLVQDLQDTLDKLENVHHRALYFRGRVLSVIQHVQNAQVTFSAYYQIAVQETLKQASARLGLAQVKAMADAEFNSVLDLSDDMDLDNLVTALDVLVDQIKQSKRLAMDKYKIGADQVNASAIHLPNVGLPGGSLGSQYPNVMRNYQQSSPAKPQYDDEMEESDSEKEEAAPLKTPVEIGEGLLHETPAPKLTPPVGEGKPIYVEHHDQAEVPPEAANLHEIQGMVAANLGEATASELEQKIQEWHKNTSESTPTEVLLSKPVIETDDPFLGHVALVQGEEGAPSVEPVKSPSQQVAPVHKKARTTHYDDEDDEVTVENPVSPAPADGVTTPLKRKERTRVTFSF